MKFATLLFCLLSTFSNADQLSKFENELQKYKGKVVYIDFWASWCVPCRKSFPWMHEMQKEYAKEGFTVLSINLDSKPELAQKFLEENPYNFPIFYDHKGEVAKAFKLKGMPSSYIVNREGKIVSAHVGFTSEKKEAYKREIKTLLGI